MLVAPRIEDIRRQGIRPAHALTQAHSGGIFKGGDCGGVVVGRPQKRLRISVAIVTCRKCYFWDARRWHLELVAKTQGLKNAGDWSLPISLHLLGVGAFGGC